MKVWAENDYDQADFDEILDFNWQETAEQVSGEVLKEEGCPYEAEVNLLLTDNEEIHRINKEQRGIDRATDVLSFPCFQYDPPSAWDQAEGEKADNFDPETGRLMLGDIVISVPKVKEQSEEYGHSTRREFAFLVAHSTLHLIGYDHMTKDEETDMFARQERALETLGITRDK